MQDLLPRLVHLDNWFKSSCDLSPWWMKSSTFFSWLFLLLYPSVYYCLPPQPVISISSAHLHLQADALPLLPWFWSFHPTAINQPPHRHLRLYHFSFLWPDSWSTPPASSMALHSTLHSGRTSSSRSRDHHIISLIWVLRVFSSARLLCPFLFNWPTPPPPPLPSSRLNDSSLGRPSLSSWTGFHSVSKSACTFHHAHHRLALSVWLPHEAAWPPAGSDCPRAPHKVCTY